MQTDEDKASAATAGHRGPALARVLVALRALGCYAGDVLADSGAYDRYLASYRRGVERGHIGPPMTEKEFWRAKVDYQDTHPNSRCC